MKRALTILALAALPVFADEPAKTTTTTKTATAAEPARLETISAAPASAADSPLVAAARKTKRAKKSTHKITNANLGRYGSTSARITTSNQAPPPLPPAPPNSAGTSELRYLAEREAARQTAQAEAARKAKEEADRRQKAAAGAERAEEGMYGETDADAGYGEGEQPQAERPRQEKKPPQS